MERTGLVSIAHPLRVRCSRERGAKWPKGAKRVDRRTPWGNPCVDAETFRMWLLGHLEDRWQFGHLKNHRMWILNHLPELAGQPLACWCQCDKPCHADVLAAYATTPGFRGRPGGRPSRTSARRNRRERDDDQTAHALARVQ